MVRCRMVCLLFFVLFALNIHSFTTGTVMKSILTAQYAFQTLEFSYIISVDTECRQFITHTEMQYFFWSAIGVVQRLNLQVCRLLSSVHTSNNCQDRHLFEPFCIRLPAQQFNHCTTPIADQKKYQISLCVEDLQYSIHLSFSVSLLHRFLNSTICQWGLHLHTFARIQNVIC